MCVFFLLNYPLYLPYLQHKGVLSLYNWQSFYPIELFLPYFLDEWRLLGYFSMFRIVTQQQNLINVEVTVDSSGSFSKLPWTIPYTPKFFLFNGYFAYISSVWILSSNGVLSVFTLRTKVVHYLIRDPRFGSFRKAYL